jgi:hypothetical protein
MIVCFVFSESEWEMIVCFVFSESEWEMIVCFVYSESEWEMIVCFVYSESEWEIIVCFVYSESEWEMIVCFVFSESEWEMIVCFVALVKLLTITVQYFSYIVAFSFIGGGNQRPAASHCQTLSISRIQTHNVSGNRYWLHRYLLIQLPYDHDNDVLSIIKNQ